MLNENFTCKQLWARHSVWAVPNAFERQCHECVATYKHKYKHIQARVCMMSPPVLFQCVPRLGTEIARGAGEDLDINPMVVRHVPFQMAPLLGAEFGSHNCQTRPRPPNSSCLSATSRHSTGTKPGQGTPLEVHGQATWNGPHAVDWQCCARICFRRS